MDSINEKTTAIITVTFKDENAALVTPTAAYYKLDCLTTGTVIKSETQISNPAPTKDIVVTSIENKIQDQNNTQEEKILTLRFTYASGTKQGTAECRYKVVNLQKLT